jgi:hypothetical protein
VPPQVVAPLSLLEQTSQFQQAVANESRCVSYTSASFANPVKKKWRKKQKPENSDVSFIRPGDNKIDAT